MKTKLKHILLIIGVVLIVFGALIPIMFKENKKDTFTSKSDMTAGYYYRYIYVTSQEDYEIIDAVVVLKNAFNEHDKITKSPQSLSGTNMFKTKEGKEYVYQITINLTRDEFFDYTEVESVSLTTSMGQRVAKEEKFSSNFSWKTPVMIIVIFFGIGMVIGSIMMFVYPKIKKSSATKIRQKVKNADPSIRLDYMTDEEVLNKYESYVEKKSQIEGINLDQVDENGRKVYDVHSMIDLTEEDYIKMFGGEVPSEATHKICGYCGSENELSARKCSSCGASIKSKK